MDSEQARSWHFESEELSNLGSEQHMGWSRPIGITMDRHNHEGLWFDLIP